MIVNFPNEDLTDFEETKENIDKIKHYLDGPQISYLTVGYGSLIYNNFKKFNIEHLEYTNIDKIMFPKELLEQGFNYLFNYKKSKEVKIPEQNVEVDPRSKTTADGAFNYIPTGDKEKVRGTKRMLAEKKKEATWY